MGNARVVEAWKDFLGLEFNVQVPYPEPMNATLKQVIVQLPLEDRLELLDAILESVADVEGQNEPLNATQRDLVRTRLERMQREPKPGTPWREFMTRLEAS